MTRCSITTVLRSFLVALVIAVSAPAVGADPPCILDNMGDCAAEAAAGGGQAEYDMIRTALEMASAATSPAAVNLAGPASEPYQG
jgi:hypothetical protein